MRDTIHNYVLAALNAAGTATSQTFVGNFLFQFHPEGMNVLSQVDGKLVKEEIAYNPVCLSVLEETPFAEKNGRSDWLAVFQIMFRVAGNVYDSTDDPAYAVIKSAVTALNATVQTSGSVKIAFKTREPKYLGFQYIGKDLFVIVECAMNLTTLAAGNGYYGTSCSYTLGGVAVDVVSFTKSFTRRFYTYDVKSTADPDFAKPIGSTWVGMLRFNWWGNSDQLKEVQGTQTLEKTYALVETHGATTETWTVVVENATEVVQQGALRQFQFTLRKYS